jgi:predicted permease
METFWQDLRYGLRMLGKSPGFTVVAILTLALGIGANTAIFSLIDAVMLRSIPVRDPGRLAVFAWKAHSDPKYHGYSSFGDCGRQGDHTGCSFSYPLFEAMRTQATSFSGMTAIAGPMQLVLSGNGSPSMARGELVAGDFFSTAGVGTALGRALGPADDSSTAPPAIVLSYAYWQKAFGGDRDAVGRTIKLNGTAFSIVGVTDPHFTNLAAGKTQDFFLTLAQLPVLNVRWLQPSQMSDTQSWWLVMLGRLKDGVSIKQAQAAATSIFRNQMLHGERPRCKPEDNPEIILSSAQQGLSGQRGTLSTLLYVLMSAVGFVLLIACANLAGLTLARASARQREIAVRLSLGASRPRMLRQLLTESVMLSVAGGVLGVLIAYWGVHSIMALVVTNPDRPFGFIVAPDWRVMTFTILASVLTGILFGLAPALRSTRLDLTPALKGASTPVAGATRLGRRLHLGGVLVVGQVALSIVVLIGAGLLVRTLKNLRDIDPGFDTQNILLFGINPTLSGYKDAQIDNLYRDLQDRFAALPNVLSASYSSDALLSGSLWSTDIHLLGQPEKSSVETDMLAVGPGFFSTLHIGVLAGRMFNAADFASAALTQEVERAVEEAASKTGSASGPAATPAKSASPNSMGAPIPVLVNGEFAKRYLGKQDALGVHLDDSEGDEPRTTPKPPGYQIIGVVSNTKYDTLRSEIRPAMYEPLTSGGAHFELRTTAATTTLVPMVRDIVNQAGENLPIFDISTQAERIDQLLVQERLMAKLSSFFGLLALVLACIGLYGLLSYEVARRTKEIGVRMALGAQRPQVLHLVASQGLLLVMAGGVIGAAAAFGVTRYLVTLLYGVHPMDPFTFAAVGLLLLTVAVAACLVPARRAISVDPMVALRYE